MKNEQLQKAAKVIRKSMKNRIAVILFALCAVVAVVGIATRLSLPRELFDVPYSTIVYSSEGDLLGARIAEDGQWRFPQSDSLPAKFVVCLTAFEDKRFFRHRGVDPLALARAVRSNLRSGSVVSGGSTITMQLARIARGNRQRTLWQKGMEAIWATHIESKYSKDEILNIYSSHAPFGGNIVGLETAAWRYFGRSAHDLSWAECAVLAVLPNAPALIHPGRNRQALLRKRDGLLAKLREQGIIDDTEFELACMEPLPDAPHRLPDFAPHLTDRMVSRNRGQRSATTIKTTLQRRTQEIVDRYVREYASNHIYNVAAIIADVETGEVIAYAGNASYGNPVGGDGREHGCHVDVITAPRSTGSVLKPLLYAGLLTDGMILPGTLVSDVPLSIDGFTPQNYNRQFYGAIPANRAIERSLNVPLVRMLGQYNTGRFLVLLREYGMTTLKHPEGHYGASLILGGAEGTLWDMAGMYASLARTLNHFTLYNSRYNPADVHPLTLTARESEEPILSPADKRLTDRRTLSAASIWFAFEAMSGLNRPEEEADWQQFRSMKRIAWKTGTSYGARDGWAIGVTPRHVVGVWVGNASGEGRAGLTGVANAAPVMFDLFSMLPDGGWFPQPLDEMQKMAICRRSGYKASSICDEVDSLYMPTSGVGTAVCPHHRLIHLSPDGLWRVNSSCESVERIVMRPWFTLPPAQEYYYRNYNPEYRPLPPYKAGCTPPQERDIEIIYPEHNATLFLPVGFSGVKEKFVFRAAHADPDAALYWYVDEDYIGTTIAHHHIALEAGSGRHLLTLADENGNIKRINFTVK